MQNVSEYYQKSPGGQDHAQLKTNVELTVQVQLRPGERGGQQGPERDVVLEQMPTHLASSNGRKMWLRRCGGAGRGLLDLCSLEDLGSSVLWKGPAINAIRPARASRCEIVVLRLGRAQAQSPDWGGHLSPPSQCRRK